RPGRRGAGLGVSGVTAGRHAADPGGVAAPPMLTALLALAAAPAYADTIRDGMWHLRFRYVQGSGGTFNGSTHLDYTDISRACRPTRWSARCSWKLTACAGRG